MRLLWEWIELYGIPKALYTDRKNVYVTDRPAPDPPWRKSFMGTKELKKAVGQ